MSMLAPAGAGIEHRSIGVLGAALAAALLFSAGMAALSWKLEPLVIVAIVAPFPLVILRIQSNGAQVVLAAVLATTIVGMTVSKSGALAFVSLGVIPGLLLGEAVVRGRGILRGCVWAGVATTLEAGTLLLFGGERFSSAMQGAISGLRSPELIEQARAGGLSPENLDLLRDQLGFMADALALLYPGLLVILGGALVLMNAMLIRIYLARRNPAWLMQGEFERLRWPLELTIVFVAAVGSLTIPVMRSVGSNVLLILASLFALQGVAILVFYLRRLASAWLRFALVLVVLGSPWSVALLALLGLFDNWLNARRWVEVPTESS